MGGVKNWSKLPTDSTKKLPTRGRGVSKFRKKCWLRLWMVPKTELAKMLKTHVILGTLLEQAIWLCYKYFYWGITYNLFITRSVAIYKNNICIITNELPSVNYYSNIYNAFQLKCINDEVSYRAVNVLVQNNDSIFRREKINHKSYGDFNSDMCYEIIKN